MSESYKQIRKCKKCGGIVLFETELDYPYYCPNCDENMYEFETEVFQ